MTRFPLSPTAAAASTLLAALLLSGCSALDSVLPSDKVDYRSAAQQTTGLEVPPDLTQLARTQQSPVQGGVVTASAMTAQQAARPAQTASGAQGSAPVAMQQLGDARLERSGQVRWLHTSASPQDVWPKLQSFWQEHGFQLAVQQPEVGVMETNWLENRAKLPQDFIRRSIGRVFDGLYSTGERDAFRTRIERNPAGGSDIYITHRGMAEVYTNTQRDNTAWQPRAADPQLEATMLSRLLLALGGKAVTDGTASAAPTPAAPAPAGAVSPGDTRTAGKRPLSEVPSQLNVAEGYDRAWMRVGQSLDRHGFTIEDRDRQQGLFFLRYADPTKVGKEEPNFFQRLFGRGQGQVAGRYRVSVKGDASQSVVKVQNDQGQQVTDDNAKRILSLLMDDLR